MLVDARDLSTANLAERQFDVCICGAGVAGITLALSLRERGLSVALLEGGGIDISAESQQLYEGKNVGLDYFDLDTARLRFLGGTSNHWGGWCRPLDEHDFTAKRHHELSGWPIAKSDLDPYDERTRKILDIAVEPGSNSGHTLKNDDFNEIVFWRSGGGTPYAAKGDPTNFKTKYLKKIQNDEGLLCLTNASVTDVLLADGLNHVTGVKFVNGGRETVVSAAHYIICFGGVENARFLLNCDRQIKAGIGNEKDLVGRFFCEHPHFTVGYGMLNEQNLRLDHMRFVAPTRQFMAREETNNCGIRLIPNGFEPEARNFKLNIYRQVCMLPFAARLAKAYDKFEKWWCDFYVHMSSEQSLNRNSRVRLSDEKDALGQRKVVLDWRLNDLDHRTITRSVVALGEFFAVKDLGRIRVADWLLAEEIAYPKTTEDEVGGYHHMCTTRMSDDPRTGVVDADCKVFGLDNLFIGGSSVFSTSGHANPTFSIVQLSLRLADTIVGKFAS